MYILVLPERSEDYMRQLEDQIRQLEEEKRRVSQVLSLFVLLVYTGTVLSLYNSSHYKMALIILVILWLQFFYHGIFQRNYSSFSYIYI